MPDSRPSAPLPSPGASAAHRRSFDGKRLTIVVPVHDEAACVEALVREIAHHVTPSRIDWEVLFVDDGSRDDTPVIIARLAALDPRVKGLRLSRNCGHQAALTCGLRAARGDIVVTMDGDLQHPPSFIPVLLDEWTKGAEVVNTVRRNTGHRGLIESLTSRGFYTLFNRVAHVRLVPDGADFRLLDRTALDALNALAEAHRFLRGQVAYIGFRQAVVEFDCAPRFAGSRSYTLRQSLRLAAHGLFGFSTVGLRLPLYLGAFVLALTIAYFGVAATLVITGRANLVPGWLSLALLTAAGMGLQFVFLGILGVYVGNIFMEVKRRPAYFVERTWGAD